MPRTAGKQPTPKTDCFTWTADEVQLLLKGTNKYTVQKSTQSVDWESVQSKYGDILDMFQAEYPNSENAAALGKEYPHKPEDITKATLSTKLKAVRKKFRQKVDSGRKSGHGHVVLLYYELCQEIWGGSPATNRISSGLEPSTLIEDIDVDGATDTPATVDVNDDESESLEDEEGPQNDATPTSSTIKHWRELLHSKLKCYKQMRKVEDKTLCRYPNAEPLLNDPRKLLLQNGYPQGVIAFNTNDVLRAFTTRLDALTKGSKTL
ncbi:hypothetical protein AWC38_SpisGene15255 [Stylophora pistillata]|uniref:Uncharacterized protein n=1 Tax=Stylophora pistillata TaxID=50429 RepID=A0A2B4RPC9_STYPI|nr:hypothetical protein AWC38_SpisGene15255 [Stylophora pistillata]